MSSRKRRPAGTRSGGQFAPDMRGKTPSAVSSVSASPAVSSAKNISGEPVAPPSVFDAKTLVLQEQAVIRAKVAYTVREIAPQATVRQIETIQRLSKEEYLAWKYLAQRLNTWTCRKCLAEYVAEQGGRPDAVSSNGSSVFRSLKNAGFRKESAQTVEGQVCEKHPDGRKMWDKLTHRLPVLQGQRRSNWSAKQREQIRAAIGTVDAFTGEEIRRGSLEIDHRVSVWVGDEAPLDYDDPEAIRERYQALSSRSNAWKREQCKKCGETGKRPQVLGVAFWTEGGEDYSDDVGCRGCFFSDPHGWRAALNSR